MSKHTKQTEEKTEHLRQEIQYYRDSEYYSKAILKLSEVQNKDQAVLDQIKYKIDSGVQLAKDHGYVIEYKVVSTPTTQLRFNCVGCRKRKTGDYYNVGVEVFYKRDDGEPDSGWFRPIAKVCSKECGELMMLRLM